MNFVNLCLRLLFNSSTALHLLISLSHSPSLTHSIGRNKQASERERSQCQQTMHVEVFITITASCMQKSNFYFYFSFRSNFFELFQFWNRKFYVNTESNASSLQTRSEIIYGLAIVLKNCSSLNACFMQTIWLAACECHFFPLLLILRFIWNHLMPIKRCISFAIHRHYFAIICGRLLIEEYSQNVHE
jgi:hypothetical protein